jgi:hypothetical protein
MVSRHLLKLTKYPKLGLETQSKYQFPPKARSEALVVEYLVDDPTIARRCGRVCCVLEPSVQYVVRAVAGRRALTKGELCLFVVSG